MTWHYIAVQDNEGEFWLHEQFAGFGHTENPVCVGAESVVELAALLRAAADDIERMGNHMSDEIERLCERLEKAATSSNDGDLRGVSLEAAAALRAIQAENERLREKRLGAERVCDLLDNKRHDAEARMTIAAEAENERLKAEVERLQGTVALLGGRVDAQDMRDASSLDLAREWEDHCKRAEAALADARSQAFGEAALVARNACLVPPDGGSPTEAERLVCDEAERRIRALAHGEKG